MLITMGKIIYRIQPMAQVVKWSWIPILLMRAASERTSFAILTQL